MSRQALAMTWKAMTEHMTMKGLLSFWICELNMMNLLKRVPDRTHSLTEQGSGQHREDTDARRHTQRREKQHALTRLYEARPGELPRSGRDAMSFVGCGTPGTDILATGNKERWAWVRLPPPHR